MWFSLSFFTDEIRNLVGVGQSADENDVGVHVSSPEPPQQRVAQDVTEVRDNVLAILDLRLGPQSLQCGPA